MTDRKELNNLEKLAMIEIGFWVAIGMGLFAVCYFLG